MSILARSQAVALRVCRAASNPGPVVYSRAGVSVTLLEAGIGKTEFEIVTEESVFHEHEAIDLFVAVGGLELGDGQPDPQRGDTFSFYQNGKRVTFEVMAPHPEDAWRWSDPERTEYRIHGKKVQEE